MRIVSIINSKLRGKEKERQIPAIVIALVLLILDYRIPSLAIMATTENFKMQQQWCHFHLQ